MTAGGVLLSVGSQINILPGGYIGVVGKLCQQSGQYQSCCGVHPIGEPEHILLAAGGKLSCNQPQFQGNFFWYLLCIIVLRKSLMGEMN